MDDSDFSLPSSLFSEDSISNKTSNTSKPITKRRGRGRPAKTHSDVPAQWQIQDLSESDQEKVLERAKNNEASRKSRLKQKQRDNDLKREEAELKTRSKELKLEWEQWKRMENKLKAAMKRYC